MWKKDQIKTKLQENDEWVCRGIIAIFDKQTNAEQVAESTMLHNNVGFNGVDAGILSSFAKQLLKKRHRNEHLTLSKKQMFIARKKMPKYAGQLANIANGKL